MIKENKLFGYIYCATSPSTKKYYGKTIDTIKNRKNGHRKGSVNGKNIFSCAIRKYGFDNFIWTQKEEFCVDLTDDLRLDKIELNEILCERETYWIKKDKTYLREFGYNGTLGGDGVIGHIWTSEERLNRSKLSSGEKNPNFGGKITRQPEVRKKISEGNRGKTMSEDSIKKIKVTLKQFYTIQENRDKCARPGEQNGMYNKYVYDIWVEKFGKEKAEELWNEKGNKQSKKMSGGGNPMSGKSVYDVWLQNYGKEEADKRKENANIKRKQTWELKRKHNDRTRT